MPDTQEVPATGKPAPPPKTSTASNGIITAKATGGDVSVQGDRNKTIVHFKTSFAEDNEALVEDETMNEEPAEPSAKPTPQPKPKPDKGSPPTKTTPTPPAGRPTTPPPAPTPNEESNEETDEDDETMPEAGLSNPAETAPYAPTAPLVVSPSAPAIQPAGLATPAEEPTNLGTDIGGTAAKTPTTLPNQADQSRAAADISQSQQSAALQSSISEQPNDANDANNSVPSGNKIMSNPLFKKIIRFVPMAGALLGNDEKKLEKKIENLKRARKMFENAKHIAGLVDGIKSSASLISEMTAILPVLGTIAALLISIPLMILYTFFGNYLRGTLSVQVNKVVKAIDEELKPLLKMMEQRNKRPRRPTLFRVQEPLINANKK